MPPKAVIIYYDQLMMQMSFKQSDSGISLQGFQISMVALLIAGTITAQYKAGVNPIGYTGLAATINGQLITNYENEGYWEITPSGGNMNTTAYNLVLRGNALSTVNSLPTLRIIKSSNHTAWNDNPAGDGNHVAASGTVTDFTIGATGMSGFSWFNIGSNNTNPLPVTLTNLSAKCSGQNEVDINWSTTIEQNTQKFIVEKSRNTHQWNFVSEQAAAGNSSQSIGYAVLDQDPLGGISYYRLVQVDNNGEDKIYGPVSVSCAGSRNGMMVFPNPSKGEFTVEISSDDNNSQAEIRILDLAGKTVTTRVVDIEAGNNQVMFNETELQRGSYIVRLISGNNEMMPVRIVVN